ncbi:MAG: ImmA/IrrE family metallo-endopeptidase [Deltaproteobacteria bacterium]|nr:ImmA/IrrE family metallo-endopeptidase [Deltaproteobacteria bacterium]
MNFLSGIFGRRKKADPGALYDMIIRSSPVPVEYCRDRKCSCDTGCYDIDEKVIYLSDHSLPDDGERVKTLLHELAHHYYHHGKAGKRRKRTVKMEEEIVEMASQLTFAVLKSLRTGMK